MVTSGRTSSGRGVGVDRFYSPPAVRRQLEQQRQQQQQVATLERLVKAKPKPSTPPFMAAPAIDRSVIEHGAESDDYSKPSCSSSSSLTSHSPSPSPPPRSMPPVANLDRFLECTTPMVPHRNFRLRSIRGWRTYDDMELRPYFRLGDLWESFKEWSAYGAGVPLVLNGGDCVVQYYVPYLSAIQLYTDASGTTLRSRHPGEESDAGIYQDTSSDVSSESETERAVRKRRDSSTTLSHKDQHSFVGEENGVYQHAMLPVFEYLEHNPPYGREPLADKISQLANKFPQLKTYRSYDLLPSSWISVAWYPIYRIPTGPTLRDLDACFLTFHNLSTPLKDSCDGHSELNDNCRVREANDLTQMSANLSLPVFGLASYKLKGSIWTNKSLYEQQLASSLLQAAENWLQHLKVDHPDFRFFLSHYNTS